MSNKEKLYQEMKRKCCRTYFLSNLCSYAVSLSEIIINTVEAFVWWITCSVIFVLSLVPAFLSYLLSKLTGDEFIYYVGSKEYSNDKQFNTCIVNWIFNQREDNGD